MLLRERTTLFASLRNPLFLCQPQSRWWPLGLMSFIKLRERCRKQPWCVKYGRQWHVFTGLPVRWKAKIVDLIEFPLHCEPESWVVVFNTETKSRWGRLVRGRFKHVRAFAICPGLHVVLFYDLGVEQMQISVAALGPESARVIQEWVGAPGASAMIEMKRLPPRMNRWPIGLWCTSGVAHLLGLRLRALPLPDNLWDACLKAGGRQIGFTPDVPGPGA